MLLLAFTLEVEAVDLFNQTQIFVLSRNKQNQIHKNASVQICVMFIL